MKPSFLFLLAPLLFAACSSPTPLPPGFHEDFANPVSTLFQVNDGSGDAIARQGLPGLEFSIGPATLAGPAKGAGAESADFLLWGSLSARLRTAASPTPASTGAVSSLFFYANDGKDRNKNGLPDNGEIDFEWLAAEPGIVIMTMWTDYHPRTEEHRRVYREVELATGSIRFTRYGESFGSGEDLAGIAALPESITPLPGYDSSRDFYTYGIDRQSNRVVWWIIDPRNGQKIILWDFQGPAIHIPQGKLQAMVNLWHTSNWTPAAFPGAVNPPPSIISSRYQWIDFQPLSGQ